MSLLLLWRARSPCTNAKAAWMVFHLSTLVVAEVTMETVLLYTNIKEGFRAGRLPATGQQQHLPRRWRGLQKTHRAQAWLGLAAVVAVVRALWCTGPGKRHAHHSKPPTSAGYRLTFIGFLISHTHKRKWSPSCTFYTNSSCVNTHTHTHQRMYTHKLSMLITHRFTKRKLCFVQHTQSLSFIQSLKPQS